MRSRGIAAPRARPNAKPSTTSPPIPCRHRDGGPLAPSNGPAGDPPGQPAATAKSTNTPKRVPTPPSRLETLHTLKVEVSGPAGEVQRRPSSQLRTGPDLHRRAPSTTIDPVTLTGDRDRQNTPNRSNGPRASASPSTRLPTICEVEESRQNGHGPPRSETRRREPHGRQGRQRRRHGRKPPPHTGIDCGSTCVETFTEGETITLKQEATEPGSIFLSWSGNCTPISATECEVEVQSGGTMVTAAFAASR